MWYNIKMIERLKGAHFLLGLSAGLVVSVLLSVAAYAVLSERASDREDLYAAVVPSMLLSLINGDRAEAGVSALTPNALLTEAAKQKAEDMAAKGYFAHMTPSGETPLVFLDRVGYRYRNVGENLGINYADAEGVETAWLNSPKHKESLLYPQFTEVGIGVSEGTYKGTKATFVVTFFATPLETGKPAAAQASVATTTDAARKARITQIEGIIETLRREIERLSAELETLR